MVRRGHAWVVCLVVVAGAARADDAPRRQPAARVQLLKTPGGVRFGLLGEKKPKPAPTVFLFASSIEGTLNQPDYDRVGALLAGEGWLRVALDVPCPARLPLITFRIFIVRRSISKTVLLVNSSRLYPRL